MCISFGIYIILSKFVDSILTISPNKRESNVKVFKLFDLFFAYSQNSSWESFVYNAVFSEFFLLLLFASDTYRFFTLDLYFGILLRKLPFDLISLPLSLNQVMFSF